MIELNHLYMYDIMVISVMDKKRSMQLNEYRIHNNVVNIFKITLHFKVYNLVANEH